MARLEAYSARRVPFQLELQINLTLLHMDIATEGSCHVSCAISVQCSTCFYSKENMIERRLQHHVPDNTPMFQVRSTKFWKIQRNILVTFHVPCLRCMHIILPRGIDRGIHYSWGSLTVYMYNHQWRDPSCLPVGAYKTKILSTGIGSNGL